MPPSIIASTGVRPVEQRPAFGRRDPFVGGRVGEQQMQALEHADQRRDAGQLVLAQGRAVAALDPVEVLAETPSSAAASPFDRSPGFRQCRETP